MVLTVIKLLRCSVLLCLIGTALPSLGATTDKAERNLYRYVDENGIQVINSTVPPKYAQRGYDIITVTGELIERVAPAPTDDKISEANRERAILEAYENLHRRYSTIDDIEDAKRRRLEGLNTNISIINGTILSINNSLEELMKRAAAEERAGRKVSEDLLDQISDTQAELRITEGLLKSRKEEYQQISEKFDKDVRDFVRGEALAEKKKKPQR